jgi:hypothetical protein
VKSVSPGARVERHVWYIGVRSSSKEKAMDIGKPKRIHHVEPLREPVPPRQVPREAPRPVRRPAAVPAK